MCIFPATVHSSNTHTFLELIPDLEGALESKVDVQNVNTALESVRNGKACIQNHKLIRGRYAWELQVSDLTC